jgi:tetratricopeptide (TPR) repeat protein
MSSSSSTPPADRPQPARPQGRGTNRAVLRALLTIWCLLIAFAVISLLNPPWLRALSSGGQATEAHGYVASGDQLMRLGNNGGALTWYDRALRVDPDNFAARINRAIACGKLGLVDEGLTTLRETLDHNPPQRGSILYNMAELHRQRGDLALAVPEYQQALAAGATPELVYGRLGEIHAARGETAEACAALRSALRAREEPAALYRRAFAAMRESKDLDSVQRSAIDTILAHETTEEDLACYDMELIRDQIEHDPERARLMGRLGGLEAARGERAAAVEHLRESLRIWPGNPEATTVRSLLERLSAGGPIPAPPTSQNSDAASSPGIR